MYLPKFGESNMHFNLRPQPSYEFYRFSLNSLRLREFDVPLVLKIDSRYIIIKRSVKLGMFLVNFNAHPSTNGLLS